MTDKITKAIEQGRADEVRRELDAHGFSGIEVRYHNELGHVPLFKHAVFHGNLDIVKMFLDGDAFDRVLPQKYPEQLMKAVEKRHTHILAAMMEAGFDPEYKDENGLSAMGAAHRNRAADMLAILQQGKKSKQSTTPEITGWHLLSDDCIAHVSAANAVGCQLTTVFNFATQERVTMVRNTHTNNETHDVKTFTALDSRYQLEAAADELCRRTGRGDIVLHGIALPKKNTLALPGRGEG